MRPFRFFMLFLMLVSLSCGNDSKQMSSMNTDASSVYRPTKGGLISTRFKSLEELKSVVDIEYFGTNSDTIFSPDERSEVHLTHACNGQSVTAILEWGISDHDLTKARDGNLWDRIELILKEPYLTTKRNDLIRVFNFARRRGYLYGEGDVAFYDVALVMFGNISTADLDAVSPEDHGEKGFINTFNHITAQAFLATVFSEKFTDFIADMHERGNLPELVSGKFTAAQLKDRDKGPVDNYVDIINNEWGQELGKTLKAKYGINRYTHWTDELLANYLNDIQSYYSWAFQINFKPFDAEDRFVKNYVIKINRVMNNVEGFN